RVVPERRQVRADVDDSAETVERANRHLRFVGISHRLELARRCGVGRSRQRRVTTLASQFAEVCEKQCDAREARVQVDARWRQAPHSLTEERQSHPRRADMVADREARQTVSNQTCFHQQRVAIDWSGPHRDLRPRPLATFDATAQRRERGPNEPDLPLEICRTKTLETATCTVDAGFCKEPWKAFPRAVPEITRSGTGREQWDVLSMQVRALAGNDLFQECAVFYSCPEPIEQTIAIEAVAQQLGVMT